MIRLIDRLTNSIGRMASWLTLVMVLMMVCIVVLRYMFQYGSIAMQESIMYMNALVFTLGAAYTLKEQGHVRVDIFYNRLNERKKAIVDVLGGLFLLLPTCIFIIVASWNYVAVSWRIGEGSLEVSGLPFVYLLKTCIIMLALLLGIQGLAEMMKSLGSLFAKESKAASEKAA